MTSNFAASTLASLVSNLLANWTAAAAVDAESTKTMHAWIALEAVADELTRSVCSHRSFLALVTDNLNHGYVPTLRGAKGDVTPDLLADIYDAWMVNAERPARAFRGSAPTAKLVHYEDRGHDYKPLCGAPDLGARTTTPMGFAQTNPTKRCPACVAALAARAVRAAR